MIPVYCGVEECEFYEDGLCNLDELHIGSNNEKPTHTEEVNCLSFECKLF